MLTSAWTSGRGGAVGIARCLVGQPRRTLQARAPAEADERDLSRGDWIVNPGGVGQPRDGDPRAAWLLLDLASWNASWRRVEYAIDEAARAIEEAGLPRVLAERLYSGQ